MLTLSPNRTEQGGAEMIYNNAHKRPKLSTDCLECKYFDKKLKKCKGGLGKTCFEYDPVTKTLIDPVTHLPIKTL